MLLPEFSRVLDVYEQVREPLGRWISDDSCAALGKHLREKSGQLHPQIMVYGVYNAGKSTLLNALMGRADASMADRPETDRVSEYEWRGYTLLDTPGIDAPIEHEAVASDSLDGSDVVLFVVAAGGSTDEASTWDALLGIVKRDRRVLLIVNNKLGLEPGGVEALGVVDKMRGHLQQAAGKAGIEHILDKVPVHMVNARIALRGRLEDKSALVERSGILDLERGLASFLLDSDSGTVFAACCNDLEAAIDQARMALEQKGGSVSEKSLLEAEQQVEIERVRLTDTMNLQLEKLLNAAQKQTVAMIGSIVEGGQAPAAASATAESIVSTVGERLIAHRQTELVQTERQLKKIGQTLAGSQLRAANANLDIDFDGTAEEGNPFISPIIREALSKVPRSDLQGLTEHGVKTTLEMGKDLLPKLFKGIGDKTMTKWADIAGRWIGPLVQVGITIHGIYDALKQEQQKKEAISRRAKAVEDAATAFIGELREAYRHNVALMINEIFEPVETWIEEQKKAQRTQSTEIDRDRLILDQASLALRRMG